MDDDKKIGAGTLRNSVVRDSTGQLVPRKVLVNGQPIGASVVAVQTGDRISVQIDTPKPKRRGLIAWLRRLFR